MIPLSELSGKSSKMSLWWRGRVTVRSVGFVGAYQARHLASATVFAGRGGALEVFKVKTNTKTAHDSYEAWRDGDHDDLVLALSLGCWCIGRRRPLHVLAKAERLVVRMGDLTYAVAKLGEAVEELKGSGDVRGNLFRATMNGLAPLVPDDFPAPLHGEYEKLLEALSWLPGEGGPTGKVGSTIRAMSDQEAEATVEKIRSIYVRASTALHGDQGTEQAMTHIESQEEEIKSTDQSPRIVGPPKVALKVEWLRKAIGKTISEVEFGVVEGLPEWVHEGEAIVLHFTDGTALSIELGSNAKNLSDIHSLLKPGDFHTDLITIWRDRPSP